MSAVPTGLPGLPASTGTDCPGGICNVVQTPEELDSGKKVAVVLTVSAVAGAAALLLFSIGAFNGK